MNPVRAKRMAKERQTLEKSNPDYFVNFTNDNLFSFDAYIYGAPDSLYKHKLIKVHIDIPEKYPFRPPTVKFIQHGKGRVHPNLYAEGKVCLSILGTWPGEPWAQAMSVETVLITIRSLLDNQPFTHEPNQRDDPNYNDWVQYATWQLLLLDYLQREQGPVLRAFLDHYLAKHGPNLLLELQSQAAQAASRGTIQVTNKYDRSAMQVKHKQLINNLSDRIEQAQHELSRLVAADTSGDISAALQRLDSKPEQPVQSKAKMSDESKQLFTCGKRGSDGLATEHAAINSKKKKIQMVQVIDLT